MATGKGLVEVELILNRAFAQIKQLENRLDQAGKVRFNNLGGARSDLVGLVNSAHDFGKSMDAANARVLAFGASVGVIVGMKQAFVALIRESARFNDEMVKINSTLNVSNSSLEKFGDSLFSVAQRTATSIRDVNKAALEFSRQGLSLEETLKRTESALILSRVAGIDAADAVKKLTAAVNTFQSQGIKQADIIDRIIKVEQAFAVDSNDLSSAIERSGAVAVQAGVKFNDFLGIVTAVQERTARGGAVIGNSLKTIFGRLNEESRLRNLEGILNIELFDENENPLAMVDRLKKISGAVKNTTDQLKREQALFQVGGTYQKNITAAIVDDFASANPVFSQAAKDAENAAGTAAAKNQRLNTSIIAQYDILVERTRELAVNLAELGTNDFIRSALDSLNELLVSLDGLLTRTDALGISFKALVNGISSFIGPFAVVGLGVVLKFFGKFIVFTKESIQGLFIRRKGEAEVNGEITKRLGILKSEFSAIKTGLNEATKRLALEKAISATIASRGAAASKTGGTASAAAASAAAAAAVVAPKNAFKFAAGMSSGNVLTPTMSGAQAKVLNSEISKIKNEIKYGVITANEANRKLMDLRNAYGFSAQAATRIGKDFAYQATKLAPEFQTLRNSIIKAHKEFDAGRITRQQLLTRVDNKALALTNPIGSNRDLLLDSARRISAQQDEIRLSNQIASKTNVAKQPFLTRVKNSFNSGIGSGIGYGAAFALPVAGSLIDQNFVSKGRSRIEMNNAERFQSSALTEGLGFASTGAIIGSAGGPMGAVIGGLIGALAGLARASTAASLSLNEMRDSIAKTEAAEQEQISAISQAGQVLRALSSENLSEADRSTLKEDLSKALAKNPNLQKFFAENSPGDFGKLSENELSNFLDKLSKFGEDFREGSPQRQFNKEFFNKAGSVGKSFLLSDPEKTEFKQGLPEFFRLLSKEQVRQIAELGSSSELLKKVDQKTGRFIPNRGGLAIEEYESVIKDGIGGEAGKFLQEAAKNAEVLNGDLPAFNKAISEAAKQFLLSTKVIEEFVEQASRVTGKDQLRKSLANFSEANNRSRFNSELVSGIQALQLEVNEAFLSEMENTKELIRNRAATGLSKLNRDFVEDYRKLMESQVESILNADLGFDGNGGPFSNLTPKQFKDSFADPARLAIERGDAGSLEEVLKGLRQIILDRSQSSGKLEQEERVILESLNARIDESEQLRKNKQLQALEIQVRSQLNSSLKESEEATKKFVQKINEAQAQFNFKRISGQADLDIAANSAAYQASRFIGNPSETARLQLKTELETALKQRDFNVEGIRGNASYELKRIVAQQKNTLALERLTDSLNKFIENESLKIAGIDPAQAERVKNSIDNASSEKIQNFISSIESGKGVTGDFANVPNAAIGFAKDYAKNELLRRRIEKSDLALSSILGGGGEGVNASLNKEAVLAAERIRSSGRELTQQNFIDEVGGELGAQVREMRFEEWALVWEALNDAVMGVSEEMEGFRATQVGINEQYKDLTEEIRYAREIQIRKFEKEQAYIDALNLGNSTPEELESLRQASERDPMGGGNDLYGSFDQGMRLAFAAIQTETLRFQNELGQNIPMLFRDNMSQAIIDITTQASSVEDALLKAAASFFGELNKSFSRQVSSQLTSAFSGLFGGVQQYASGGRVSGGSGLRDDVPAMLTSGEFVMKRSAVQKYGTGFMSAVNNGGIAGFASGGSVGGSGNIGQNILGSVVTGALSGYFNSKISQEDSLDEAKVLNTLRKYGKQSGPDFFIPGVTTPNGKYQGAIAGPKNLLKFVGQEYTSGAQDIIRQSGESLSVSLEDESLRLGIQGRLNSDISREVLSTKNEALGVYQGYVLDQLRIREEEKAQKEAQKKQLISSLVSSVAMAGISAGAAGFSGAYGASKQAGGSFGANIGAGIKGIYTGEQGFGGISNIFSGTGFMTYGGKATMVNESGVPASYRQDLPSAPAYNDYLPDLPAGDLNDGMVLPPKPEEGDIRKVTAYGNADIDSTTAYDIKRGAIKPEWQYLGNKNNKLIPGYSVASNYYPHGTRLKAFAQDGNFMGNFRVDDVGGMSKNVVDHYAGSNKELYDYYASLGKLRYVPYMSGGNVPAMLNSGEFVMGSGAASKNKSMMGKMNRGVVKMSGGEIGSESFAQSQNMDGVIRAIEKLDSSTRQPQINITINSQNGDVKTESSDAKNQREEDVKLAKKIESTVKKVLIEEQRQGGMLRR